MVFGGLFLCVLSASVQEEVFVHDPQFQFLNEIKSHSDWTIDHKNSEGYEVYGGADLPLYLLEKKILYKSLKVENLTSKLNSPYPSYEELTTKLQAFEKIFPELLRLFSIGKTVQGRDLWVVEISSHIADALPLPEVKYISSMHGNEITGRELMVLLIEDLLRSYDKDSEIKKLIDHTRIFILPSMNPDGSELATRGNAHYADLNRNFPDFSTEDNEDSEAGREPETQAVMRFQRARNFSLSANFHGGAEVVNYMWDTLEYDHPFLPLLITLSKNYSGLVSYMKNSTQFVDGITNGYAWYEVNGGMQDWSYHWYNDLQFTIELSNQKWPDYSEISSFYMDNREALVQFLKTVHQGAGISFSKETNGFVTVLKNENREKKSLGTFPIRNNYFYKVLEPGDYSFQISTDSELRSENFKVEKNKIYSGGNFVRF